MLRCTQPCPASSSLSASNCCFISTWKRNPGLHLIKRIGMADPHNQSQSLSNMLYFVTTKLAWRKVNYGCSLSAPLPGFAVILYSFCSCFHYANMDCARLTHSAFSHSYSRFLFPPLYAASSCRKHGQRVCWGVYPPYLE